MFYKIDRTKKIKKTDIDNDVYSTLSWWEKDDESVYGLHKMNTIRVNYLHRCFNKYSKINPSILDIGCGGGILTEEIYRLLPNSKIIGIDIDANSIEHARLHAKEMNLSIKYIVGSAYKINIDEKFDYIVMSDVLEHLDDLPLAIQNMSNLLKPNGVFIFDTFNRTFSSWFYSIFLAQNIIGLLPRKTHDWTLFITPDELSTILNNNYCELIDINGFDTNIPIIDIIKFFFFKTIPRMFFNYTSTYNSQYFGTAIKKDMNL